MNNKELLGLAGRVLTMPDSWMVKAGKGES